MGMVFELKPGDLVKFSGMVGIFINPPASFEFQFISVLPDGSVIRSDDTIDPEIITARPYEGEVSPAMWQTIRALRVAAFCTVDKQEALGSLTEIRLHPEVLDDEEAGG